MTFNKHEIAIVKNIIRNLKTEKIEIISKIDFVVFSV